MNERSWTHEDEENRSNYRQNLWRDREGLPEGLLNGTTMSVKQESASLFGAGGRLASDSKQTESAGDTTGPSDHQSQE